jgi:hypothetical protein
VRVIGAVVVVVVLAPLEAMHLVQLALEMVAMEDKV